MRPDGYWIGHPGALLGLPGIKGKLTRSVERAASFSSSAGGNRRAYLSARREPLRVWQCTIPAARPDEAAALSDLLLYTTPPYVWVDPESRVTNLLSPAAAGLQSVLPALPLLGRQPLEDGRYAATGAANPSGALVSIEPAPALPGMPVTASAYLASSGGGGVAVLFRDSAGHSIGDAIPSGTVTGSDVLHRASVTATPPVNAAAVEVQVFGASVIARPALTWTADLLEYGPGGGAGQVLVSGWDETILQASASPGHGPDTVQGIGRGPRLVDLSFTVTEVG